MKESVISQLKPFLPDFLRENYGIKNISRNFKCITGTHEDRHPSMSYHPDHYVKCFACGFVGNIVTVASTLWGCPQHEAIQRLEEKYLTPVKSAPLDPLHYLKNRGLTEETIRRFGIECLPDFHAPYLKSDGTTSTFPMGPAVKIPAEPGSSHFLVRSIRQKKFYKPVGSEEPLFFASELRAPIVFVTESVFCAMLLCQLGQHAVALNGTGWQKLMPALEKLEQPPKLILSLDKDPAGEKATQALYDALQEQGYSVINYPVSGNEKDPGELFLRDSTQLNEQVERAVQEISQTRQLRPNLLKDYLAHSFLDDLRAKKALINSRKSGFPHLDEYLHGFGDGLYLLGGRPGVGKTTFVDHLAWNLAEHSPVLYFSYEQQSMHFAAKQLSRISYEVGAHPFKSRDLLSGDIPDGVLDAIRFYLDEDRDIFIYSEQFTVDELTKKVLEFEEKTGLKPVIIVDFIQKIPVPGKISAKDAVDLVVSKLERFTHEGRRTMLLISSFNRVSYYSQITIESFRESGNIEYAADVILGLQYQALSQNSIFLSDGHLAEKQAIIKSSEQQPVRALDLVCLKNRYGMQFSVPFSYHTEYDSFEETIDIKHQRRL